MKSTALALILISYAFSATGQEPLPVIDMHLHAGPGSEESTYYTIREGETPDEARLRTLFADMEAHNVVYGIVGGPPAHVERFRQASPVPLIGGVILPCINGHSPNLYECYAGGGDWPDLDRLRADVEAGRIGALGELYNVHAGASPLDPRMEPYLALAVIEAADFLTDEQKRAILYDNAARFLRLSEEEMVRHHEK